MAGYFDEQFSHGQVVHDARWRGHQTPPDPEPFNGTIRVLHEGRWMTWDQWEMRPIAVTNCAQIPAKGGTEFTPICETENRLKRPKNTLARALNYTLDFQNS